MAAESTATFLFDADGNIDRVRDTEGRVYYLASTLATTAAEAANAAAAKADTAAETADAATSAANNMETARREAETARVEAEKARELAQAKNNADQAANNSAAQGLQVVILGTGEYDPTTLEPTVTGAVGKMYMVPNPDADTDDAYIEWMLISGKWERVGLSNATIETLTTDQIDTVAADGQLVSDSVLNGTGLAYLWAKLRAAFAAIGHKHSVADVTGLQTALDGKAASSHTHNASDVTSGALSIAHGGTGAATAAAARTSLGAASAADLAEVRDSVSHEVFTSYDNGESVTVTPSRNCTILAVCVLAGVWGYAGHKVTLSIDCPALMTLMKQDSSIVGGDTAARDMTSRAIFTGARKGISYRITRRIVGEPQGDGARRIFAICL